MNDTDDDPLDGWREKYDGDPFKVFQSSAWGKSPFKKMFFRLLGYIKGQNEETRKIEMTKPVTVRHEKKKTLEMCFWVGSKWEDKDMPRPEDERVYFQEMKDIVVYIRSKRSILAHSKHFC